MNFKHEDLEDLRYAKELLENPGLAAQITNLFGVPIEKGFELLPENWSAKVTEMTHEALSKAVDAAVLTMKDSPGAQASDFWHKIAVAASGGLGGFFGLPALAVELPVSTTIMLRSISDIARAEGESINDVDAKMACVEVFSLGGPSVLDDASESGYYAIRTILAKSLSRAAEHIAERGLSEAGAPALVQVIRKISERFSVRVSEKMAAQSIPAIGAAGGAIINTLFMDHFQDMARGHFIIRRLERKYDKKSVEGVYNSL